MNKVSIIVIMTVTNIAIIMNKREDIIIAYDVDNAYSIIIEFA